MRFVRYGERGVERPGILKSDGRIVDILSLLPGLPDLGPLFFTDAWVRVLENLDGPGPSPGVRLGPPVARPEKIICLGKNYADHAREGNMSLPGEPLLFCKTPNTVCGPNDPVVLPESSGQVDFEVELAVVVKTTCRRVSPLEAMDCVAGYMVMNDVSGREAQFGDKQWFRGKSFDMFAPMGPVLVTPDELGDPGNLTLETLVNGNRMQAGNTRDLIFKIPEILAYISRDITLVPGDVISTGTPAGVGIFRDPPVTLSAGDVVECRIEGIGALQNRIVAG
jgi:2-keto-4-pentenoate hydratase/2-oxohepta-3-ene-1,7-dioic acid hydratase in catechol pathway